MSKDKDEGKVLDRKCCSCGKVFKEKEQRYAFNVESGCLEYDRRVVRICLVCMKAAITQTNTYRTRKGLPIASLPPAKSQR